MNKFSTTKKRDSIRDAIEDAERLAGNTPISSFIIHKTRAEVPDESITPNQMLYRWEYQIIFCQFIKD
jgi:hypothetical protein